VLAIPWLGLVFLCPFFLPGSCLFLPQRNPFTSTFIESSLLFETSTGSTSATYTTSPPPGRLLILSARHSDLLLMSNADATWASAQSQHPWAP
jgi:hypothetical protein